MPVVGAGVGSRAGKPVIGIVIIDRTQRKQQAPTGTTQATSIASKPAGISNHYRHRNNVANNTIVIGIIRIASNRHRNQQSKSKYM